VLDRYFATVIAPQVGVPSVWKVIAVDLLNNTVSNTDLLSDLSVSVVGYLSGRLNHSVFMIAPGVLGVQLVPVVAETLQFTVKLSGLPIRGSPFSSNVAPGFVCASCDPVVADLNSHVEPDTLNEFVLFFNDQYGAPVAATPHDVDVIIEPSAKQLFVEQVFEKRKKKQK
jgi:hypothetical protein